MTTIKIIGIIGWEVTAREVIAQINRADGDIEIKVDSIGGDLFESFSIANAIADYDKGTIIIIVNVSAMSAMSYILSKADKVIVHDNSVFMMHNPSGGVWGDFRSAQKMAKELYSLRGLAISSYAETSGKDAEEIGTLMNDTTYYYGQEIVDAGFADEVIVTKSKKKVKPAKAIATAMLDLENLSLEMKKPLHTPEEYEALISACGGDVACEMQMLQMEQPRPSKKTKESNQKTGVHMTKETLMSDHPELATQMQAEGKQAFQEAVKATMGGLASDELQRDGVMTLVMEGKSIPEVKAHLYDLSQKEKAEAKAKMIEEGKKLNDDLAGVDSTPPETEAQKSDVQMRSEAAAERRKKKGAVNV